MSDTVTTLATALLTDVDRMDGRISDIVDALDDMETVGSSVAVEYAQDIASKLSDIEYAIRQIIHHATR